MSRIEFDALPADARLWIFAANRSLGQTERREVLRAVDDFLDEWTAHGIPLAAGRDLRYDQFLLIGVDERRAGASGCSVDALVRRLREVHVRMDVDFLDNAPVLFRTGNGIERVSRDDFAARVAAGAVTLDTVVFDNSLSQVGDVRLGRWETPAGRTWHRRAFF